MTDNLSAQENEDLLTVHEDDQAIEASEDTQYDPREQSNVVVIEPPVISIGRGKRLEALRKLKEDGAL